MSRNEDSPEDSALLSLFDLGREVIAQTVEPGQAIERLQSLPVWFLFLFYFFSIFPGIDEQSALAAVRRDFPARVLPQIGTRSWRGQEEIHRIHWPRQEKGDI